MKRWLLLLVLLAGVVGTETLSAAGRAAEILGQMAAGLRDMKGYEVDFSIEAGDYHASGSYAVRGEGYTLSLGDAEVYCDGRVRYEVDKARREVTIVGVDTTSRNILNNPVRAFDFLGDDYRAELLSETGGRAVIRLTPVAGSGASGGVITVTVATDGMRPEGLDYDFDGEQIRVAVQRVKPLTAPLAVFDRSRFEGFEFIDFR